jgi:purine-binding chemotaxis protein CheW
MVVNFERIIADQFAALSDRGDRRVVTETAHESDLGDEDVEADELQLVSFSVHGQEYAADIAAVQEIVQMPARVTALPKASHQVLGLMTLRERLLPLVSLRAILNLPATTDPELQRVVVFSLKAGQAVGVVTDSVDEVLRVPRHLVEPLPSMLSQTNGIEEISSVCRLEGGRRLVSVVDVNRMLNHDAFVHAIDQAANAENGMQDPATDIEEERPEDEEQVVVFRLGSEEFGVPIAAVQEIVRVPEQLTFVPKAPDFVEGVINLRGSVLPVMDQRRRLGLEDVARNERQRIMVYVLNGRRIGFIVDAVSEVLKIPRNAIEEAPHLSGEQRQMLGRVANLEKQRRMILLIEPSALLSGTEMTEVAKVA